MHEIVSFRKVFFEYDQTPILRDLDFSVFPGEFIHVIGPNGGGKTTLLKLLMGLIKPSRGQVKVNQKDPTLMESRISYVPQTFQFDKLFPLSVIEVVLSGRLSKLPWHGRYSSEDRQKAIEALKLVGMESFKKQPIGELSGGQVQRVLIARALASDPQILLLDEPTSCIDPGAQTAIEDILKRLKRKLTIIMVTHDLDHIGKNADRVFCIHGHLSEIKPAQVCHHLSMGLYAEKEEAHA